CVIDALGRVIGAAPTSVFGDSVSRQPWFGVAEGGKSISDVFTPDAESDRFLVTAASPARRPGDAPVGVVAITVSSENLLAAINRTPTSPGGQVLLVDGERIVAARDQRLQGRTLRSVGLGSVDRAITTPRPDGTPQGTLPSIDLPGRGDQVVAWDTTTGGAQVVVLEPRAVLLAPITRLADRIRIALLAVSLVTLALALLVARRLTRPVRTLTLAAQSIEADQDFATEELERVGRARDDLGRLARVFARMAEQVFTREKQLRAQVQALKVEIDQERRKKDVSEIVDSDFFTDLQAKAADMRRRAKGES
ncbi:MAG: HAMP domain-containing protein, partial [Actinomycetota bacterium]